MVSGPQALVILTENEQLPSCQLIAKALKIRNMEAIFINPFASSLENLGLNAQYCLIRTSGIRRDDFDLVFAEQLERHGTKLINPVHCHRLYRDKFKAQQKLADSLLPTLPNYAFRGRPDADLWDRLEANFSDFWNNAVVLKNLIGNQGLGTCLLNGRDSAMSVLDCRWAMQDMQFFLQPFVQVDREVRVLVAKNSVIACAEKKAATDFRANARSADFVKVAPDKHVASLAIESSCALEALYSGVDLIQVAGKWLILEVNLVPGLASIDKASGDGLVDRLLTGLLE